SESQKQAGGSGWGSLSEAFRVARIRTAFLVSRHPSAVQCTPGPCPGSRVRIRPPSHSTTANSGGLAGHIARASSVLGSASRRWANSGPTSCTTRSIVLAETWESPTCFMTIVARSNERASAAPTAIRCTKSGVSLRASRPSVSLRGEKAPTALGAIGCWLVDGHRAVDGGQASFLAGNVATGAALWALDGWSSMSGQIPHMLRLNPATELSPEFVGSSLNDRVVGDADDGTGGPIEGHRDLGGLSKQFVKFFLQRVRRPIHDRPLSCRESIHQSSDAPQTTKNNPCSPI